MKIKRAASLLLALCLLCGLLTACGADKNNTETTQPAEQTPATVEQPVFETPAGKVNKTETVYVNLDTAGKATQVSVSDWLHTDSPEVYVDDVTDLKDVTNVKSDILPVVNGEALRWNLPETDLYYSGTGKRALPLSFEISYTLNGKPVTAEEISGKSGDVTFTVSMKNTEYKDVTIGGAQHRVYLPLLVVGGAILPEGTFSGVEVTNGQSIGDGSKEIVVFTGMPGFAESLGISGKDLGEIGGLVVSESFTVRAHTEDFSLTNMYFAALPIASLNFDLAMPETVEDLKSTFAALKTFQNALNEIDPDRVLLGLLSDQEKVNELMQVLTDAITLYSNNRELIGVLGKYATPENFAAIEELLKTMNDPEMQQAIKLLSDPTVQLFFKKLPDLMASFETISPILSAMQEDLKDPTVAAQVEKLPETMAALSDMTAVISENEDAINILLQVFNEDGTQVLEGLLQNIDLNDLSKLQEKYGGLAEQGDLLLSLAQEWLHFGRDYGLYTKSAPGMTTSLAFVFNTPGIAGKTAETAAEPVTEAQPWYKKLFS
ncbi:MAG: hypothetical protein IK080_12000 [Clostridia bacterium]|nr:hypothetical protein [Clostridia bacterium]